MNRIIQSTVALMSMCVLMYSCTASQVNDALGAVLGGATQGNLSQLEASNGLKDALKQGLSKGAEQVSVKNGFYKNPSIKILFPEKAQKVSDKLNQVGMGSLTDILVEKINNSAEDAAKSAKPIFFAAIREMTFTDALTILTGQDDAATNYLRSATSDELYTAFNPVINKSLNKTGALDQWEKVVTTYNKIPLVQKANPRLDDYVTNKAMDGLFHMVQKEEANIRKNPGARSTALLKKVFAYQDK